MTAAVESDPALAIGSAKDLIETCCKTILAEGGKPAKGTEDVLELVKATRTELKLLTAREATMSCCRRSAFSVISSARERVRSAMNPLATPEGRHALPSALIAWAARRATVAGS